MEVRNQQPGDTLVFELIGDDDQIVSFVNNFRTYVGQVNLFTPMLKLGLPSRIIFKTCCYGDQYVFIRNSYDTKIQFKIYDNKCDVNAVISIDSSDEYINFVKTSIGYKRHHPFFISYDVEDETLDLAYEDDVLYATDFHPYVFIKEIIDDVLPVNMELVVSVSDRAEMILLQNASDDKDRDNCFSMLPRDVVKKIANKYIEIEFKNDPCSFKFFRSDKNIQSNQHHESSNSLIKCSK